MTSVLSNNSTTQPLLGSAVFFGSWVSTSAFQAIKVSVLSDQIGTLIVQHATTGATSSIIYEDTKAVDADTETFLETIVKAAFFRVKYENGTTTQTSFKLQTTSGLQYGGTSSGGGVASEVEVTNALLAVKDASSVALLQELVDTGITLGAVDISGVTLVNGRLPTVDVSGLEQLTAISGYLDAGISVTVSNLPALQETHDASSVDLLQSINDLTADIEAYTTPLGVQPVHVDLQNDGPTIWADSTEPWVVPANGEEGWAYLNTTQGGANIYYYTNSPAFVPASVEPDITLGSVSAGWFIGNQKLLLDTDNRFILLITTQPTGSGDASPAYHSSRAYQVSSSVVISKGADYFFYWGTDPMLLHPELKHVEMSLAVENGDCDPVEVVQFMSVNVPSNVPANEFNGVVKKAGFVSADAIREVVFDNSVQKKAETQLGLLDFSGSELLVRDSSAIALLAEIADGITVQVGEVEISGVVITEISGVPIVEISGNVTVDVTFPTVQVVEVSGVPIVEISGNVTADVTFPTVQVVEVSGVAIVEISGVPVVEISGNVTADVTFPTVQVVEVSGVPVVEISGVPIVEISGNVTADVTFPTVQVVEVSGVPVVEISGNVYVSGATFIDSKLTVFDASSNEHLFAIEDILETGFVNVYDASCELVLEGIKTQTDKLSFYADAYGAFDLRTTVVNEVGVSVNNTPTVSFSSGSEVGLTAGTQVALASGSQVQLVSSEVGLTAGTQVGLSAGASVDVGNFPTKQSVFVENTAEGFDINVNVTNASIPVSLTAGSEVALVSGTQVALASGTQVALASGSQVQLTGLSEVTLVTGSSVYSKLQDNNGTALTSSATEYDGNVLNTRLFGYDVANDLVRPVRQGENGGLFVENITSVDFEVVVKNTPTVEISGNVVVSDMSVNVLNTSLDVHNYASSDGTTWHHLASDANGRLNVNARAHDGVGNDIASTDFGTFRALNVNVSNTTAVPISNTNANALYSRALDVSNVQVATNASVTGPVHIGGLNADTQGYTYISAIMSFTSVTTGGQIYLEVSHDGSTIWARPSSASVFVMSSGASVSASILLSSPVPFRYARLWADTGFVAAGCNAFICLK